MNETAPTTGNDADYSELAASYGLVWQTLDHAAWDEHIRSLSSLAGNEHAEIDELFAKPTRPFLARSLTQQQRMAVDEGESLRMARASLELQDRIARIPIHESLEPVVCLESMAHEHRLDWRFSDRGFHEACGEWAGKPRLFWVRTRFAERIKRMADRLRRIELSLHFEDAFRPLGVQEGLVKRRIDWIVEQHPNWTREQILTEARSKTAVTPRLASHKAGAAVDVRLWSVKSGELIDIGHNYAEGGALVQLDSPFVTQIQWQNRRVLLAAATLAGIAMYPGEDWHLSFGDNLACHISGTRTSAQYGPIKSFDMTSGAITETYNADELDQVML